MGFSRDKNGNFIVDPYNNSGETGSSIYKYPGSSNYEITTQGTPQEKAGEMAARKTASMYYGSTPEIGAASADYRKRVAGSLDKSSGLANRYIQSANADISRANARAGMGGVNTSSSSIREKRNAMAKGDEMQQQFSNQNLSTYGKSIGAGISGTESLAAAGAGRALASTSTPTPDYGSGCPFCIVATKLFLSRDMSKEDLLKVMKTGRSFDKKTYIGYIILAQPFLNTKSAFLKNKIIPAFKTYSEGYPNLLARTMIFTSKIVGSLYKLTGSNYHVKLLEKATINDILMKKELSC